MDLKLKDVSRILQISDDTVIKWMHEKNLPGMKIGNLYYFNKSELHEWILKNNIVVSDNVLELAETLHPVLITDLVGNSIFYNIKGNSPVEVISYAVNSITSLPETERSEVLNAILEREEIMNTGIGEGIAIPHPRNPVITDIEEECLAICMLENNIDFKAIDGKPVHTLFIILSANAKRHLEILSKISLLCRAPEFMEMLKTREKPEKIKSFIEEKEIVWNLRRNG